MALPMQFPGAVRGNLDVFEPKSDVKSNTSTRKRRRTRYAEYKRGATRSREGSFLLEEAEFGSDESEALGGGSHSRTRPRQIRRSLFTSETLDSAGTRKYGRLFGRQSNPTAIGENLNRGGQNGNGNGVGNANANGNLNPPPPAAGKGEDEESESESDSDSEEGEVDTDDEEEAGKEDAGEKEGKELEEGELSPSATGAINLEASETAAAIVTATGAPSIAPTGAPCDPAVSQPSEQCESPAPDLLQPFQKAAIATGATVSGIVALLVFAFCFMRSRHGTNYSSWPCVRRYRRKKLGLNPNTESGITILPPPPFQKEDPWIITNEGQSWTGGWKPPLASEMKKPPREPSKLQRKPLIRRLLGEPLESNPVTRPPSISSPLHPELTTGPAPGFDPSRASDLFSPRNNNRLTTSTRSSQALPEDEQPEISDTRSVRSNPRPQNSRRLPGVSYFSWTASSPTTTGPNKYQSFMSRSNKRETTTTVDSEPARFRTISSWVNQQYKRVNGTNDQLPLPPVPRKDNQSTNSPLSARAADSPLKQSMEQNTNSPTKPPPLLSKPTPPHPPIRATPLRSPAHNTPSAQDPSETSVPPVPPLPSPHSLPPPPPTPLKPRADSKYHQRTFSVSTNETAPTASVHRKNASSTASSLPTIFKHHPGDKVEIN